MANVVKFKINGLSSALNNVYTRVTDLSRNELYSGETLVSDASGNVELDIGTAGSNGQGVIVYGDNYSAGNESTFKSFTGYSTVESFIAATMSGTWLFVLDSLTGGTGNVTPPPRYVAEQALSDGELGKVFVRSVIASSPVTNTGVGLGGTNMAKTTGVMANYVPNGMGITVADGANPSDTMTMSTNSFPWSKARVYFIKSPTGGFFDISEPQVVSGIDTSGNLGEIGYVDITNPNGLALTSIKHNNFSGGDVVIAGWVLDPENASENAIDVMTFALAGRKSSEYNECLNIKDWYSEMGIDHAYLNIGTNDSSIGATQAYSEWSKIVTDLNSSGVDYSNMLLVRPNENALQYNGMWEDLRDQFNIPFASIMRIWGDLAEFQANGWMVDTTHPNNTWNEIFATELYNNRLVSAENALDLGVEPNWVTELNTTTYVRLNSPIDVVGDFEFEARVLWVGTRSMYIVGSELDTRDYVQIQADGKLRIRIDNVLVESLAGAMGSAGWKTIKVSRVGTSITALDADGNVIVTGTSTSADWHLGYLCRTSAAYSIEGKIAWVTIRSSSADYGWLLNQGINNLTIPAYIGSSGAVWVNRTEGASRIKRLSHLPNGDSIDYYSLRVQQYPWGSESWPS